MIEQAADLLRRGELVAFPTETVYGLGADATNADAVRKIFAVKGRPATNPLIVHVADESIARRYCVDWPGVASKLANAFWPGPLTLVVEKSGQIPDIVTAGKQTVGLRAPDHPIAMQLLRAFDGVLAAPSANRSNRVSPTTAAHVRDEFGQSIPMILDGGACRVGIESTVLDLTTGMPTILRPGAITQQMIESAIQQSVAILPGFVQPADSPAASPGQHVIHYAPVTPAFRFDPRDRDKIDPTDAAILPITLDADRYAQQFYARLRMLDQQHLRAIYIELPPDHPDWQAIRDRILRATQPLT